MNISGSLAIVAGAVTRVACMCIYVYIFGRYKRLYTLFHIVRNKGVVEFETGFIYTPVVCNIKWGGSESEHTLSENRHSTSEPFFNRNTLAQLSMTWSINGIELVHRETKIASLLQ